MQQPARRWSAISYEQFFFWNCIIFVLWWMMIETSASTLSENVNWTWSCTRTKSVWLGNSHNFWPTYAAALRISNLDTKFVRSIQNNVISIRGSFGQCTMPWLTAWQKQARTCCTQRTLNHPKRTIASLISITLQYRVKERKWSRGFQPCKTAGLMEPALHYTPPPRNLRWSTFFREPRIN